MSVGGLKAPENSFSKGNEALLSNGFGSFESVRSYLEFYESIPDYRELDHLSNEEFYSRLKSLKITQTRFCGGSWSEELGQEGNGKKFENKRDGCVCCSVCCEEKVFREEFRKSTEGKKDVCGYCYVCSRGKQPTNKVQQDNKNVCICCSEGSAKKLREKKSTGDPPKINVTSDNDNHSDVFEFKKFSGYEADRESSSLQPGEKLSGGQKRAEELGSCSRRSRSLPISPGCWCPTPGFCRGLSEVSFRNDVCHSDLHSRSCSGFCFSEKRNRQTTKPKKVRPIPITSRIPLFDKIMLEKEARRRIIHDRYSEELRSLVKPFSFTRREEEKERLRMISSNPELTSFPSSESQFKAKPIPKNLFSNYAYEKMKEEEFYRALKRKIRAEEMLKASSLPPSMARRERMKCKSKSLDFLDCRSTKSWNKLCGYRKMCKEIGKEIEIDIKMKNQKRKTKSGWMSNSSKRINSATDSSTEISPYNSVLLPDRRQKTRPHSAVSCSRNNLASVLRIETARRRLEKEMEDRLRESRARREAKFKARLLRMTPAWRALGHDKDEDWALRLAARREEEREKTEAHRRLMESMYGRVHKMPPLFQRQTFFGRKNSRSKTSDSGKGSRKSNEPLRTEETSEENQRNRFEPSEDKVKSRTRGSSVLSSGKKDGKENDSDDDLSVEFECCAQKKEEIY